MDFEIVSEIAAGANPNVTAGKRASQVNLSRHWMLIVGHS